MYHKIRQENRAGQDRAGQGRAGQAGQDRIVKDIVSKIGHS